MDLLSSPAALRRWSVASLVANAGLVVTGGLVRVTGSGLGCSTWPQCEPGSYTPHAEAGVHGVIEFGNRLLTFVLVAIAVGTFLAALRARTADGAPRRRVRRLALVAALGIPLQAVIGGLSVLAQLNPWVVGLHMVASIVLIALCVVLVHEAYGVAAVPATPVVRLLTRAVAGLGLVVMLLGVVVTGAGPNSGDGGAERNGLDLLLTARVHAASVWLVVALTLALAWLVRAEPLLRRAVLLLFAVELFQGAVGYAQYFLSLPPALVALHMLGTALFTAALAHLWWLARRPAAQTTTATGAAAAGMEGVLTSGERRTARISRAAGRSRRR